jgi:DNA polymerase-3 subunit epsilon
VSGLAAVPTGTLADRAIELLTVGPQAAGVLTRQVFGMPRAPDAVAERLTVALLGADPRVRRLSDGRWGIVTQAAGSPLIEDAAFAVVDVETTGSQAGGRDRVTEVAVALVHGSRCELVFDSLVNPERPIPAVVTAVTRITDAMVRAAPVFTDLADPLLECLAGRIFVAHNVRFDWRFVGIELKRARALGLDGQHLCTVRLGRQLVPGLASYGLDTICEYFGVENPARHRAGGDALATGRVLQRLLDLARGAGARTIADLERMQVKRKKKRRGRRRTSAPEDSI